MKKQSYQNHIRYYGPHHFVFLPLMALLISVGVFQAWQDIENRLVWTLFSILSFSILYLAIMLRQHYALILQNRIVQLEFRLRYFELFGKPSTEMERALSFSQIAALRFANDEEFKSLLQRAITQNLSGDEIKRSIQHWQADMNRV